MYFYHCSIQIDTLNIYAKFPINKETQKIII
jgi:hypothetical protein